MGPRPFRRGNVDWRFKSSSRNLFASMGPRPFRRGNRAMSVMISSGVLASMGPRPFRRGNTASWMGRRERELSASMGPRPFRRGNRRTLLMPSLVESSFNGATSFQTWKWHLVQKLCWPRFPVRSASTIRSSLAFLFRPSPVINLTCCNICVRAVTRFSRTTSPLAPVRCRIIPYSVVNEHAK